MEPIEKLGIEIADRAAPHADRHDREGSFAAEGVGAARELRYLTAPVPPELGGDGARTRDIVRAQLALGRRCGSTALACSMHLHVVLTAAWRWRRGDTVVEPLLRKVAGGAVIASSGGNDWTHPDTVALPVEGGWRVSGRKTFVSLAPVADVMATFAVIDEPAPGAEVIVFGVPLSAEGVRVDETWDATGMRGTGSHDVVLDEVFVGEGQVTGRRTWGELDRPLLLASVHAWPVIAASYLGVAEGLADAVLGEGSRASDRQAGLISHHLRIARWSIFGSLDDIGVEPEPDERSFLAVQHAKMAVAEACRAVAEVALEVAGGRAFARPSAVSRMVRDLQGLRYHPLPAEKLLERSGAATSTRPT